MADLVVSLEKTVDTDFPGQGFGVKASATDLQLQPIAPQELSIELKELPENDDDGDDGPRIYRPSVAVEPLEAISTETCTTMSGALIFYSFVFTWTEIHNVIFSEQR